MTSPAGDVLAESRALASRLLRATGRKMPKIVAGIAVVLSILTVLALAGAVMNDVRIAGHRATTAATVLDGSTFASTVVQFTDDTGQLRTPSVLYPAGLSAGRTSTSSTTRPTRTGSGSPGAAGSTGCCRPRAASSSCGSCSVRW